MDGVPDTKIIKASLQYRAKYKSKRQPDRQNLLCWQVVPHPSNRCGEVIRTARTKALAGDILEAGYDPVEATLQLVAVEIDVDASGHPSTRFSEHFKKNAGMDPDHYYDPTYNVLFAGLSHNSKNLTERNMLHGMPGCACDPPAIAPTCCCCKASPILDDKCRYSMIKLKEEDQHWYNAIVGGTEWEILSSDMDKEEPNAAHIIALALNNKNRVALRTGHLEVLRTLKSLCNPDPRTMEVPYDRVKAAMFKSFGALAHERAYHHAFNLLVLSGGQHSETFNDFFKWASYFVDESKRMIRLESYAVFAQYPHTYRCVIKMQLKHTWSQKPGAETILVPVPRSIAHRLELGPYGWPDLMNEVEDVGRHLPELSSTVLGKNTQLEAAIRTRTSLKWHSPLEIAMIQKIIQAPKMVAEITKIQEAGMRNQLAELIAIKLIVLAKLADIDGEGEEAIAAPWGGDLMAAALEKFRSEEWRSQQQEASNKVKAAAANKDGGVALVPKVCLLYTSDAADE